MIEEFKNFLKELNQVEQMLWLDFYVKRPDLEVVRTILRLQCLKQTGNVEYEFLPGNLQGQAERFKHVFWFRSLEENAEKNDAYDVKKLVQAKIDFPEEFKEYKKIKEMEDEE